MICNILSGNLYKYDSTLSGENEQVKKPIDGVQDCSIVRLQLEDFQKSVLIRRGNKRRKTVKSKLFLEHQLDNGLI